MTVYARSDVMSVSLSSDHGGCGATHSRPVTHGAPAKHWSVDCDQCENHLRSDPKWGPSLAEVPETPDEQRLRENREKLGASNQQQTLAEAILTIAQSQKDLPANLAAAIAMLTQQVAQTQQPPAVVDAPEDEGSPEPASPPTPELGPAAEPEQDLAGLKLMDLRALAVERGFDATGTRAELIDRLSSAE